MTKTGSELDARYGRTPGSRRRVLTIAIISGVLVAAVFVAWVVWAGLFASPAQFESNSTGTTVVSDREAIVKWEFTVPPGTAARCAVEAQNVEFRVVGWKIVDVPASAELTRTFSTTLRTTEQAVNGLIYRCWLV